MGSIGHKFRVVIWAAAVAAVAFLAAYVSQRAGLSEYRTAGLNARAVAVLVPALVLFCFEPRRVRWGIVDILLVCLAGVYCLSALLNGQKVSLAVLQEAFPYVTLYLSFKVLFGAGGRPFRLCMLTVLCVWAICESVTGLGQIFGDVPSGHHSFVLTGSFPNPGPYGGFISMAMAVAAGYIARYRRSFRYISIAASRTARHFRLFKSIKSPYFGWILYRLLPLVLSVIAVALCFVVLPASMSRAGWIAFAVAAVACAFRECRLARVISGHRWLSAGVLIAVLAVGVGAFIMKKDSAVGRFHIWNMEVRAIAESPCIGTGPGTALGSYGLVQTEYFAQKQRPDETVSVAGSPEYAFNEYLKAGMEAGLPGLLVAVAVMAVVVSVLIRMRNPTWYGLLAMGIFALSSYPLSIVGLAASIVVMLALAGCGNVPESRCRRSREGKHSVRNMLDPVLLALAFVAAVAGFALFTGVYSAREEAYGKWQESRQWAMMDMYEDAAAELEEIYPSLYWNYLYLYDYGYALHKSGKPERSNAILSEGTAISAQPMFHNIIGKNYQALGQYSLAEQEFEVAHNMVPSRLYPLVLMMEMYEERGMTDEARRLGERILSMPFNPRNGTMVSLRRQVERALEE